LDKKYSLKCSSHIESTYINKFFNAFSISCVVNKNTNTAIFNLLSEGLESGEKDYEVTKLNLGSKDTKISISDNDWNFDIEFLDSQNIKVTVTLIYNKSHQFHENLLYFLKNNPYDLALKTNFSIPLHSSIDEDEIPF